MFRTVPQLTVANIENSINFYRDKLGFQVTILDPPDSPIFAALEREEASLFLVSRDSREEPGQKVDLEGNRCGVGVRIYFEIDDAKIMYNELSIGDTEVFRELSYNSKEDYTEFAILDPDGYEIGIYS